MLRMLGNMLGNIGYRSIVTAMDGKEAWEIIQRSEPPVDIVLSDLLMPNLDGMQLLHRIRNSENFWHLPFIMVTGVDDLDKIMSVTEEHIDGYLVKPVTEDMLKQKIYSSLKKVYDPDPFHRALYAGKRYIHEGRYPLALQSLEEARNLQPGQAATYFYLAQILEKTGKLRDAEENYKLCKDCSNDLYVKSLDGLARIHMHNKEYADAVQALKKGIAISPNNPYRHLDLCQALTYLGYAPDAKDSLTAALKLARKEKTLPQQFIESCLNCGLDKQAEEIMQQNLGLGTDEIIMLNHMGIVCRKRKEYERSKSYYERALKISPSNDSVNYNHAVLLVEMKEYHTARAYLRRVLKQNPDFESAVTLLAKMDELGV